MKAKSKAKMVARKLHITDLLQGAALFQTFPGLHKLSGRYQTDRFSENLA